MMVIGQVLQRESEEKEGKNLQINKEQSRLGEERQVIRDEQEAKERVKMDSGRDGVADARGINSASV
jgi:hypothetical protein